MSIMRSGELTSGLASPLGPLGLGDDATHAAPAIDRAPLDVLEARRRPELQIFITRVLSSELKVTTGPPEFQTRPSMVTRVTACILYQSNRRYSLLLASNSLSSVSGKGAGAFGTSCALSLAIF